jgi:hypothetical protein
MSSLTEIVVHFGKHPGTTGSHLAQAAQDLGVGIALGMPDRTHYDARGLHQRPLLWVESGVLSYPIGTETVDGPTAGYIIDVHLHPDQSRALASLFDLVLVAQHDYVPFLSEAHPNVHWLPLAAPSAFLEVPRRPRFPVGFVGHVAPRSPRESVLRAVNREFAMNDWRRLYSVEEMARIYASSRLVLNPPANGDVNMRFFESLACGALVITPPLANGLSSLAREHEDYFPLDFAEERSLMSHIETLLHETDFESRGAATRELVRERHTYHHRMIDIVAKLEHTTATAPVRTMTNKERGNILLALAAYAGDAGLARQAARLGATTPLAEHVVAVSRAATRWARAARREP